MAKNYSTISSLFTDIADAIRDKGNTTDLIMASAFPEAILAINCYSDDDEQESSDTTWMKIAGRSFTNVTNRTVTTIGPYAFYKCKTLETVSFAACTSIGSNAFANCSSLASVNFTNCKTIGSSAFSGCTGLTSISFPKCTYIHPYGFYHCSNLNSVDFPSCSLVGFYTFTYCSALVSIALPACKTIQNNAFDNCHSLISINLPVCTSVASNAFNFCTALATANFPACTTIGSSAFKYCRNLSALYLNNSVVCALSNSNAFATTPYAGYSSYFSGTPYIYVPSSLITSYQTARNWSYFSSYFSAIENAPT